VLTAQHGKRIAVIENEFGEVGVDQELVIGAEEEIFEMNNGCICCTVRGDLIRILGSLMKRRDRFDYILVETTGLADPGPVAQTFFVDAEMRDKLRLDAIVTLVDAKHVQQHIDEAAEVQEQIAFADVVLVNKTDLAASTDVDTLEERIKSMNAAAHVYRTQDAAVAMDHILDVGGFDLDRALTVDPRFMEPEYPFEWAGVHALDQGVYDLVLHPGPDPTMKVVILPLEDATPQALESVLMDAVLLFSDNANQVAPGDPIQPGHRLWRLQLDGALMRFPLRVEQPGVYALFTEHLPTEFGTELTRATGRLAPIGEQAYTPDHVHDATVSSVGITTAGDLDPGKFNAWLQELVMTQGPDVYRMKGVLSIKDRAERWVFQGVHMLIDARADRPWGDEPRHNSLIFIGRNLDRSRLNAGFRACLV
jgi:G3E family GTPase